MKVEKLLKLTLIVLPCDVFAHAGHVQLNLAAAGSRFEALEVSLVMGAIALYLASRYRHAAKLKISRVPRRKKQ